MDNAQLAQLIKEKCNEKGLTIKKTLEDCGINRNFIYDLEKRFVTPSAEVLEKIADYLGVSVDYLLGRTKNPEVNR